MALVVLAAGFGTYSWFALSSAYFTSVETLEVFVGAEAAGFVVFGAAADVAVAVAVLVAFLAVLAFCFLL